MPCLRIGNSGVILVTPLPARTTLQFSWCLNATRTLAYAGVEEQRRALAAGFDAYLAKPVDAGELVHELQAILKRAVP